MKTVIECTLGATEQTVGGITYSFDRDTHGRFVNEVNSVLHRSIFLNVTHYREVPLDPPPPEDDQEIPAFLSGQGGTGEGEGTGDDAGDDDGSSSEGDGAGEGEGTGDDDGSNAGDETNALDGDQQAVGEADKQPEQAPVAAPAKKATNKSK
ncbi:MULTISPECIES: hypothetical protein [Agrobacterium tumefaciens complex]|uniref:Uncharacterized protein n=1 Tax=Agrobacterium tomkonis CFBP 6623 TaxID=1183432 RepID=A0A1S7PFL7_9HYPH|nr:MULTISPECIES: hypothetical protein [Agrobacterium tumefaciens complex]QCL88725.1 hypothetical protein CFBP6623_05975 [Agrobacterium tumefaciens]CUX20394.1 conserved hypothetical protein [Agrobacterium tomkonis CFBP 6623]